MLFIRYYLWIAPHILLAGFLVGLVRRGFQRQLPVFFGYLVFELIEFTVLFGIFLHHPFQEAVYRWAFVFGAGISSILGLAVVYELANKLLISRSSIASVLRLTLRLSLAVLVLGAAIGSGSLSEISTQRVMNIFETLDFSSSLILAGMLVTLFAFARALWISWHSWIGGVALGFGISATIDLASAALRAVLGHKSFIAVDISQMAAFHVCVVIWLVSLYVPDRAPTFDDKALKVSDMELWGQELQRMVQR